MRIFNVVFLSAFLLLSCQNAPSEAENSYRENLKIILDGHDELMKEMGTMNSLIRQLNDSVKVSSDSIVYRKAGDKLKTAHEAMFDWMHDFSSDFDDLHGDQDKQFSEEEYQKKAEILKKHEDQLSELEQRFESSISKAKEILKEQ